MTSTPWQPCAIIPVYNHEGPVVNIVDALLAQSLPVLLVDDGSEASCRQVLAQLAERDQVTLIRLPENRGKGAAVKVGIRAAAEQGFSHGLQIDADGQHALADVDKFLAAGQRFPEALVTGWPQYGDDIPAIRYYGRYLTHLWVHINSLSLAIKDSMCGFRLYPLAASCRLFDEETVGNRMDYDTEVIVRWVWRRGEVINIPTVVTYPEDGISHFDLWRDNWLISKMHAKLFFLMLLRLPKLLMRKFKPRKEVLL